MKTTTVAVFLAASAFGQAVITDSGSTNRPGISVTMGNKGAAVIESRARGTSVKMSVHSELRKRFMQDLEAAGAVDQLNVRHCAKSASFGSSTFITYGGVKSPDLSCSGQTDPQVIALQKDVDEIMSQARAKMPVQRRFR